MYSIVRSAGGCGTTTIITHLAAELARLNDTGLDVCVLDLDVQGGEVASFVGSSPKANFANLMEAGDQVDEKMMRDAVSATGYGFSLLAAPDDVRPLESVEADQLLAILKVARRQFGHVLVDLPANWCDWSLSTAVASNQTILVIDLSIASLRQAKRRIELFSKVGIGRDRLKVVVNRVQRRLFKTIGVEEVEEALGLEVIATLADEGTNMRSAQDQGVLLADHVGKSRFGKNIAELAEYLVNRQRS